MSVFDSQKPEPGVAAGGGKERRVHHHLREIFDEACRIAAPFFDPKQNWGNMPQALYARQALCDAYPELTPQDIAILFSAVERVHRAAPAE